MSSKSTVPKGRPADRDAKLAAIRRQNEADKRRSRIILVVTIAVVLALVAAIGVVIAVAANQESAQDARDPVGLTAVDGADGGSVSGIAVGPEDAAVTVTVMEDYFCPNCRALEERAGAYISGLPDEGVRVVHAPVAILDFQSKGTDYSTRAASAAVCVADADTAAGEPAFLAFRSLLFANQPPEGTEALTDDQLVAFAAQAGASEAAQQCIRDGGFEGWAGRNTDAATAAGMTGTPTVWVDGVAVADLSVEGLQAAVAAAG